MQHSTLNMCKQHFCTPAFSMHFLLFSKHDIIFRAKIVLTGKTPYTHLDQTLRWNEANFWLCDLTQSMRQMLHVWGRMRKMLAPGKCHSHFTCVRFDLSKGMDNYIWYIRWFIMYTLPETNRAPENRSSQKEYLIFQPFILKGAKCGCREGILGHLMHGSSAREFIRLPGKLLHS